LISTSGASCWALALPAQRKKAVRKRKENFLKVDMAIPRL
jgi:hypothetical protein